MVSSCSVVPRIKNGAANAASAATSLGSKVATKNPFSAGTHAVPEVSMVGKFAVLSVSVF